MGRWLTPDTTQFAENQVERSIVLPGSLLEYVSGALNELTKSYRWESHGDATPEETASYFNDIWDNYIMSDFRNVGMVAAWVRDTAVPFGWLLLGGQTVAQASYPELASVVPATWLSGSNIVLPDARGRFMVGGTGTSSQPVTGTVGGSNTHTLTVDQMPNHTHSYDRPSTPVTLQAGAGIGISLIVPDLTNSTGGGSPHNNMPSYLTIRWHVYAGR